MRLKTGLLLLAAGSSTRMGCFKQLLPYKGQKKTLLRQAAETALESEIGPVLVVLGAEAERCSTELLGLPVHTLINQQWETGMGSSIAAGATYFSNLKMDAILIQLCDQPWVTAKTLRTLNDWHSVGSPSITVAKYGDSYGPPACFSSDLFSNLRRLYGGNGAKKLIRNTKNVQWIDMPEAAFDLDTPNDYNAWISEGARITSQNKKEASDHCFFSAPIF